MTVEENRKQHSEVYKAIVSEWPKERIARLAGLRGLSLQKVCSLLGITKRTMKMLVAGDYSPSPTFCRRMEMIEKDALEGHDLATDILPARSEMRRRMLLFRAWWMNREPSQELPEVTVRIRVSWGKGVVNNFEIPVKTLPRLRLRDYSGLVETIRAVTKSMRGVARLYGKLLFPQAEEDFWLAYSTNTLPEIIAKR